MQSESAPADGGAAQTLAGEGAPSAPAAPTPAPEAKPWYDGASDEDVGYIQNKGWDKATPLEAVKAYQNLEKFHGVPADQLLRLPKDMNAEGALDPVYDRLGRPNTPDKYAWEPSPETAKALEAAGLPAGANEERMKAITPIAHKLGLNPQQFQALADADAAFIAQMQAQADKQYQEDSAAKMAELKSQWGPKADERMELARRAVKAALPEGVDAQGFMEHMERGGYTAEMLKMFANIAEGKGVVREDDLPGATGPSQFGYTREQALYDRKALADAIKADPERLSNFNKGKGPDIDKMRRLNERVAAQ
jgi:hypothetical protein